MFLKLPVDTDIYLFFSRQFKPTLLKNPKMASKSTIPCQWRKRAFADPKLICSSEVRLKSRDLIQPPRRRILPPEERGADRRRCLPRS